VFSQQGASGWQIVFYIASGIYLVGAVVYGLCASGELQSWAKEEDRTDSKAAHSYSNSATEIDVL